jgi:hypothetical protein
MMLSHLASAGALTVRALPVFLLTAIVFFNSYVWIMATTITGDRLGLAMTFLVHTGAARADAAVDGGGARRRRAARRHAPCDDAGCPSDHAAEKDRRWQS